MSPTTKNCNQEACKIRETGKCLEGIEPEAGCPHFYLSDSEIQSEEIEVIRKSSEPQVYLFSGDEISIDRISLISNRFNNKLIIIVGESDSGKTTLLATLYELFQKKPIKEFSFAGSITQIGFEKRCHLSRTASKAKIPATEKTKSKEFSFLHLSIKKEGFLHQKAAHLLISDISGEHLQFARDSSTTMAELKILGAADRIAIVIDGGKLANLKLRETAIFHAKTFLQRALDEGIVNNNSLINIVISKWDKLKPISFDMERHIREPFESTFQSRVCGINFFPIASRPEDNIPDMDMGFGLHELLSDWVAIQIFSPQQVNPKESTSVKGNRYFHNYKSSKLDL